MCGNGHLRGARPHLALHRGLPRRVPLAVGGPPYESLRTAGVRLLLYSSKALLPQLYHSATTAHSPTAALSLVDCHSSG